MGVTIVGDDAATYAAPGLAITNRHGRQRTETMFYLIQA